MVATSETLEFSQRDLDEARERAVLLGEVRVLKWGSAVIIAGLFGFLGFLYQEISGVRSELYQVRIDINQVQLDVQELQLDFQQMKDDIVGIEQRLARIEKRLSDD